MLVFKLQEILEQQEKSRYWLSKETGISENAIKKICENKSTQIKTETIEKICSALNIKDISELLELKKD